MLNEAGPVFEPVLEFTGLVGRTFYVKRTCHQRRESSSISGVTLSEPHQLISALKECRDL